MTFKFPIFCQRARFNNRILFDYWNARWHTATVIGNHLELEEVIPRIKLFWPCKPPKGDSQPFHWMSYLVTMSRLLYACLSFLSMRLTLLIYLMQN